MSDFDGRIDREFWGQVGEESPRRPAVSPGKRTVTSGMSGPPQIILRVADVAVARALGEALGQRDANGVANGAESAVARASSSSGQALPQPVREKFESSLGADLSRVRVHTGSESAAAAKAVGARAYTTGQDIHFAQGQYGGCDPFSMHLLAHEVAHTVQQAGGGSTRQHKLEVSTPGDSHEREADRAADAMVSGQPAQVSPLNAPWISRDDYEFEDDYVAPSSQMRDEGNRRVEHYRTIPPKSSDLGTTRADVDHAGYLISQIDGAAGPLGAMRGQEEQANAAGEADATKKRPFVAFNEAENAIATNNRVKPKLAAFQKSANRQSFKHTFFANSYRQLGEDFLRLQASVDVIRQEGLNIVGDKARSDIEAAKKKNPLLADAIGALKQAIADLNEKVTNADSGVAKVVENAGSAFDDLGTATDELKLPPPSLEDTTELADANKEVAAINADLAAAKSSIGTIKNVVMTALALGSGGATAGGTAMADRALKGLGKKAEGFTEKNDPGGLLKSGAVKAGAGAVQKAGTEALEGQLAGWMTNYSANISRANGKVSGLKENVRSQYKAIKLDNVQNIQTRLVGEIATFSLLVMQIEAAKDKVDDAAKKVQEQAKEEGKDGTNIGATAQAMASVSNFLAQARATEALGQQEKVDGDAAQAKLQETAGKYHLRDERGAFGSPSGLAETIPSNGEEASYFTCTISRGIDKDALFDFGGYDVKKGRIIFTVNENDVDERSVVLKDHTDKKLEDVAKWRAEASQFEAELANALGTGPSMLP